MSFQDNHVTARFQYLKEVLACVHPPPPLPSPPLKKQAKEKTHDRSRARLLLTVTL